MNRKTHTAHETTAAPFVDKMRREGLPEPAVAAFVNYYGRLTRGAKATIPESDIVPVTADQLCDISSLDRYTAEGNKALAETAVIKLNGGLGTTMGLDGPKSCIAVKNGLSFLDIAVSQVAKLRERTGAATPLLLMNSFFTDAQTREALARRETGTGDFVRSFMQHKFPKVLSSTLEPASWPQQPSHEWHPAGHGDLFLSLHTSGLVESLLGSGCRYLFVSNIDNLGAEIDTRLLGYFAAKRLDFLMEVTGRTVMDRKGGHLARLQNGPLVLREASQCDPADAGSFSDINRHPFFNTNNLWISLEALRQALTDNTLSALPVIINRKTLVPTDRSSPPVFQLESAMGSAIALFGTSEAVRVPRTRFAPVKNCDELLLVQSDYYILSTDYRLAVNPARKTGRVAIKLDPAFYSRVDLLASRFPHGAPSLVNCTSLTVLGDVRFGRNITISGTVAITNRTGRQITIEDNADISENRLFE